MKIRQNTANIDNNNNKNITFTKKSRKQRKHEVNTFENKICTQFYYNKQFTVLHILVLSLISFHIRNSSRDPVVIEIFPMKFGSRTKTKL